MSPPDQNTMGGTTVSANEKTGLGLLPRHQGNMCGGKILLFFNYFFPRAPVCRSGHCSATFPTIMTQHSGQLHDFSTHLWKKVRAAGEDLHLRVFTAYAHVLRTSERSRSERWLCWLYCSPCGADGQLKLSSWVELLGMWCRNLCVCRIMNVA